jgi:hypothetical protein
MNRDEYTDQLAGQILKEASEEIESSPLAKTASEEQIGGAVAEKIAEVFQTAAGIYKQAEEVAGAADEQEADARAVLEDAGIDPDAVIAAATEAAAAEIEDQQDEETDEE